MQRKEFIEKVKNETSLVQFYKLKEQIISYLEEKTSVKSSKKGVN